MKYRFLGMGLLAIYLWHAMAYNFLNDDAYISFRYALNLAEHGELTYNLGERVEGYTNFLWTILMAAVLWLGGAVETWSRILSIGFGAGTLLAVGYYFHRLQHGMLPVVLSVVFIAAAPAFACWSTGGLETMMFTFFLTLGWLALSREHNPTISLRSPIYFAIAAMVRPEGILAFAVSMMLLGGHWLFLSRQGQTLKRLLAGCGWFLCIFGPYFTWRIWYYGWIFPNTYYVKTGAVGLWTPGIRYVWDWVLTHGLFVLPLCFTLPLVKQKAHDRWVKLCLGFFVVVFGVHVAKVGGDFMALHRFLVPMLPLCAVGLTLAVLAVSRLNTIRRMPVFLGYALAILCAYGAFGHAKSVNAQAMTVGSKDGVDSIGWLNMFAEQCRTAGEWLRTHAPEDASIATTAAGTIPFYSRLYTVDILGLNDEWIAHKVPPSGNRPGHTRVAPESYLASKAVDYLVYHPQFMEKPRRSGKRRLRHTKSGYVEYDWTVERVRDLKPPYFGFWRKTKPPGPRR